MWHPRVWVQVVWFNWFYCLGARFPILWRSSPPLGRSFPHLVVPPSLDLVPLPPRRIFLCCAGYLAAYNSLIDGVFLLKLSLSSIPSEQLQPLSALFYHKYYSSLQFWSAVPTDFQMQIFPPLASWLTYAMLWDVFKLNICLQISMKYTILLPSPVKPQLQPSWLSFSLISHFIHPPCASRFEAAARPSFQLQKQLAQ